MNTAEHINLGESCRVMLERITGRRGIRRGELERPRALDHELAVCGSVLRQDCRSAEGQRQQRQAASSRNPPRRLYPLPMHIRGIVVIAALFAAIAVVYPSAAENPERVTARRLPQNPLITIDSSRSLGDNVNRPSIIRVPDWVERPLGRYYMYFAHHIGAFIRLAYADRIEGPWRIPGLA